MHENFLWFMNIYLSMYFIEILNIDHQNCDYLNITREQKEIY